MASAGEQTRFFSHCLCLCGTVQRHPPVGQSDGPAFTGLSHCSFLSRMCRPHPVTLDTNGVSADAVAGECKYGSEAASITSAAFDVVLLIRASMASDAIETLGPHWRHCGSKGWRFGALRSRLYYWWTSRLVDGAYGRDSAITASGQRDMLIVQDTNYCSFYFVIET